jgi:hypothetical protein
MTNIFTNKSGDERKWCNKDTIVDRQLFNFVASETQNENKNLC